MPDSPNLLFTNAGMNQFVPIFLGQIKCPYHPPRATDTQKCIRAGGKHNDLDDVGLDTYHHTFFEMLGNWSFGDYFKRKAIDWAWELIAEVWKFPRNRLYATVYSPDKAKGDPSEFDQEAHDFWAAKFTAAGLDPKVHIVYGNKKDNFWMMGETGPCGPCSELHVDLTPDGDTRGSLVNKGDARCIEIWNLVFIQFNANADGTFSPLPARHVDTGMGFERVTSIIQCTKKFTDFTGVISNYETDIFRPLFDRLEKMSGKKYGSTLPTPPGSTGDPPVPVGDSPTGTSRAGIEQKGSHLQTNAPAHSAGLVAQRHGQVARATQEQTQIDVAFRVIADHIRTLSFAIADGIQPGNTDRNYVLRRILRRAVRYGRTLGFHEPFFYKLVDVLAETMGHVFPEIRDKKQHVQEVIRTEEEAFNKTLDRGIKHFFGGLAVYVHNSLTPDLSWEEAARSYFSFVENLDTENFDVVVDKARVWDPNWNIAKLGPIKGDLVFELYDTYGFPLDLTELMARERGLTVDVEGFNKLMEEQKARGRAAHKKEVISISDDGAVETKFVGYDEMETDCRLVIMSTGGGSPTGAGATNFAIVDVSPLYAEMGGQVGDTGWLYRGGSDKPMRVLNTIKRGHTFYLQVDVTGHTMMGGSFPFPVAVGGEPARLVVDKPRRNAIERHHTVTHLLHWALHEVVSKDASQKGSFVGPDKLTFDFNNAPLTPAQVADIEKLVNERILENAGVSWIEVPYADVKSRKDVMQFFGDKYGDTVRVVQIGGGAKKLDGYSMELCGGTHTRATGEIGLFRIVSENAVAAGVRRIEAVAGLEAYRRANDELHLIKNLAGKVNSPVHELEKKVESLLAQQKELEKSLRAANQKEAAGRAKELLARAETINGIPAIIANIHAADGDTLQTIADSLKGQFKGVVVLGGAANGAVSLVAAVSPEFTAKAHAGKIIQAIAPIVGGKGGGKPDNARGGGKDTAKLEEALAKAKTLF
jgi:alanyl-tRNA synthetase